MSLSAGTRLGPYEVVAKVGEGGMGQVCRARDTRLNRTVAIKVLPPDLAGDPHFRERFAREARSISALDHPHVCALYDVGEHEHAAYLVMQFLEGETLAARLERGALPLQEALTVAIQIAGALDQAHRLGIVHRDLKPGNVMLTKSGAKLLDFGLAKTAPARVSGGASTALAAHRLTESPEQPLTTQGATLGTFQYMAPEQIEGRDADARTDVFAFGALLFEMIAGRRAFEGRTQASLIAAILEREPPRLSTPDSSVPPALDHVVQRALAKRPDDRWQTMRDVVAELEWIAAQPPPQTTAARTAARRGAWIVPALAGLAVGAIVTATVMWRLVAPARSSGSVRSGIALPAEARFGQWAPAVAISPDGKLIVYTAARDGQPTLFLRSIDRFEAEPIRGTVGARGPFFSPDSRQLGFFADGKLKRVALGGSLPVDICDAPDVRGASWGRDGTIVFAPSTNSGLQRVAATGGVPRTVTTRDESRGERTHRFPELLPGGRAVLFVIGTIDITSYADARIAVQALDGGPPKVIVEGGAAPRFAAGHLFYTRGHTLMAAPFDERRLDITGPEIRIAEGVAFRSTFAVSEYGVSDDGTVVFMPGGETETATRLVWMNPAGNTTPLDDTRSLVAQVVLSRDEQQLLLWNQGANDTLWVRDLRRGTSARMPHRGASVGGSWSHDGRRLVYSLADRMAWAPADGTGAEEELHRDPSLIFFPMASADGDSVFFTNIGAGSGYDIWRFSLSKRRAEAWLASKANEATPRPSPDGSLVAYVSDESGRAEVFIRPAAGGSRVQVSINGATNPVWSRNGRELFFRAGGDLYVSTVRPGPTIGLGDPRRLFKTPPAPSTLFPTPWSYDVLSDGRFVFIEALPQTTARELRLVQGAIARR